MDNVNTGNGHCLNIDTEIYMGESGRLDENQEGFQTQANVNADKNSSMMSAKIIENLQNRQHENVKFKFLLQTF